MKPTRYRAWACVLFFVPAALRAPMEDASLAFLKKLLETPSPSGFERPVQDVVRAWAKSYADEVRTDRHGNVLAVLHPAGNPRIMLAGHCDQIALMVEHIDDSGFLYVQPIGGWDIQILLGQNLTVWTTNGPIAAVVARRATHLRKPLTSMCSRSEEHTSELQSRPYLVCRLL